MQDLNLVVEDNQQLQIKIKEMRLIFSISLKISFLLISQVERKEMSQVERDEEVRKKSESGIYFLFSFFNFDTSGNRDNLNLLFKDFSTYHITKSRVKSPFSLFEKVN